MCVCVCLCVCKQLVVPLMALFCSCGGASGLAGGFTDLPFDAKAHLISYHTEGKGEDRVIAHQLHTQKDTDWNS